MIRFYCECGKLLQAREGDIGRKAKCPACARLMIVPAEPRVPRERRRNRSEEDEYEYDDEFDDRESLEATFDAPPRRSPLATAAMIFGLLALLLPLFIVVLLDRENSPLTFWISLVTAAVLPALIGLALGVIAFWHIGQYPDELHGRGTALTGILAGCLSLLLLGPLALVLTQWHSAQTPTRLEQAKSADQANLKKIALALLDFSDRHGRLPQAAAFRTPDGEPGLSWRVAILPYLRLDDLYKQFRLDEPWNSPHNRKLLTAIPDVYRMPNQPIDERGTTYYQVFVGKNTMFEPPDPPGDGSPRLGLRLVDATDGSSNTLLVTTARMGVPWTQPVDLEFHPIRPLPPLSDRHPDGFNACFADGNVHWLPRDIMEQTLRGYITRNGNEPVPPP